MADISVRIPSSKERVDCIKASAQSSQSLTGIFDVMYKPRGIELKNYHPNNICLRVRRFDDGNSTLVELKTVRLETGYTDEKIDHGRGEFEDLKAKAYQMGYESWGEMSVSSTEYKLLIGTDTVSVLAQTINPVGEFIKIESPSANALNELLKSLNVAQSEKIEKNAAVLLGEKLGLIS